MFGMKSRGQSGPERDLGFGSALASESGARLLNQDGSFNTQRVGLGPLASLHLYDALLTISWPRFLALVAIAYLGSNVIFAFAYMALGPEALTGALELSPSNFPRAFFFSVHTLSTVGYGSIVPASVAANALMTIESVFGIFGVALTTGLVFARFARPTAKILFSKNALIAPYRGERGLMFRIANQRSTQIIELEATVTFSRMVEEDGRRIRRFYPLALERQKVVFFPLAWTIVHPINRDSPFHDLTGEECLRSEAEILVLLKGIDETFSQIVHARSSYTAEEIQWSSKFSDLHLREGEHVVGIDLGRLSDFEPVTAFTK
ncbi:MAG: transporter [Acidobacteria bacterium]|nr:MAG: transporter [Acidobacteriota bacterium]